MIQRFAQTTINRGVIAAVMVSFQHEMVDRRQVRSRQMKSGRMTIRPYYVNLTSPDAGLSRRFARPYRHVQNN